MIKKLTHKEFLGQLPKERGYEVLGEYIKQTEKILIRDKYGELLAYSNNLIKGHTPNIESAIDKNLYFSNKLKEKNVQYKNNLFKIVGDYSNRKKILVKSKYGLHLISSVSLLSNKNPNVKNSINKNEYVINQAKEIHGDLYDYSKIEYLKRVSPVKIICKIHGEFKQSIKDHIFGQGCPECGRKRSTEYISKNCTGWSTSNWVEGASKSKNFDSFKVYVLECWNDNEKFYKIGRTFRKVNKRFYAFSTLPYNYKIIKIIEGEAEEIFRIEQELKNKNKEFKYLPTIKFHGMHECFKKLKL